MSSRHPRAQHGSPAWDGSRAHLTDGALKASAAGTSGRARTLRPLSSYPPDQQDAVATDALLSTLLGVPGSYVRTYVPEAQDAYPVAFAFDAGAGSETSVAPLAEKNLAIADDYAVVAGFVERCRTAGEAGGYVRQALAVAIGELLDDYRAFVLLLENSLREGNLSLQKLLFYMQPSVRSMSLLKEITVVVGGLSGGAAVGALYRLASSHIGSEDSREVLAFVVERASAPVFNWLRQWMCYGILDDRDYEFFVEENPSYARSKGRDELATRAWDNRYMVNKDNVPGFLVPFVQKILRAGKYVNVLRESNAVAAVGPEAGAVGGVSAGAVGVLDEEVVASLFNISGKVLLGPDAARKIASFVDYAYSKSTATLTRILRSDINVLARLRSMKRYFLLESGDFLVHFFDAAGGELAKKRGEVSLSKLQALLELSVRTSVTATDPYHDDLTCMLFSVDLTGQILGAIEDKGRSAPSGSSAGGSGEQIVMPLPLNGYDTFSLDYKITWPMSLIVTSVEIMKFQLLFRYLFLCKFVERELGSCWSNLSQTKSMNPAISRSFWTTNKLRHKMLQFIRTLLSYTVVDVVEPKWKYFETLYNKADTIDDIFVHHAEFLDSCLSLCLLTDESHLRVLHSIIRVCLMFTSYIEDFTRMFGQPGVCDEDVLRAMDDRSFQPTMVKFDKRFDETLAQLVDGVSSVSKKRASTHLANLFDLLDPAHHSKHIARLHSTLPRS